VNFYLFLIKYDVLNELYMWPMKKIMKNKNKYPHRCHVRDYAES